jgi:hypothetical protein
MLFSSTEAEAEFLGRLESIDTSLESIARNLNGIADEFCGTGNELGLRMTLVKCSDSLDRELRELGVEVRESV